MGHQGAGRRRLLVAAVYAAVYGGAALTALAQPASSAPPVLIRGAGNWDLNRLGASPLSLQVDSERGRASVAFSLPRGARQGPERWYLLRLTSQIALAEQSGDGSVFIDAAANGRTAASMEFEVQGARTQRPRIEIKTLDQIDGPRTTVRRGRQAQGDMTNFWQNVAVRGGPNTLSFHVRQLRGVKLTTARVLAASGVQVSSRSPAHVQLIPRLPRARLTVGGSARLPVEVRNNGDRPAHHVTVGFTPSGNGLSVSPRQRRLGRLQGRRSLNFTVRARRPGRYRLLLAAGTSNVNNPDTELAVTVPKTRKAQASGPGAGLYIPVGAALAVAAGLAIGVARRPGKGRLNR